MKAVFFDIDGTLISDFSGVSFFALLTEKGIFPTENNDRLLLTTREYRLRNATYEQFAKSWGEETSAGLKGKKQSDVNEVTKEFWPLIEPKVAYWVKDLIAFFNHHGFMTIAVSGSPIEILKLYQEKLGFKEVFGSIVGVEEGIYTGKTELNLVLSDAKETIVNNAIAKNHIDLQGSFGFGDNEHDRAFLDKVGNPIAISSESSLKHYAKERGWPVFAFSDNVYEEVKKML